MRIKIIETGRRKKIFLFMIILAVICLPLFLTSLPAGTKAKLTKNQFIQNFIHPYHSLRKLPDLVFFPYFFLKTDLPKFFLNIDVKDLVKLNEALTKEGDTASNPFMETLAGNKKLFVKADFLSENDNYRERVDARYRGLSSVHWNSYQKSFCIKFPSSHFFKDIESLNLVIPYDRDYYAELLNMYRAKKLGLKAPDMFFVRLYLNGQDTGVYLAFEHWSQQWLKKQGLDDSADIFGLKDSSTWEDQKISAAFSIDGAGRWESYVAPGGDMGKLISLLKLTANADDGEFRRQIGNIFDLDKFYAWDVLNILANSNHQNDDDNIVLLFNSQTNKFELVPWDVEISMPAENGHEEELSLAKRILSIPEFRAERDKLLKNYIENRTNLEDDLNFYDGLVDKMKKEFLSDTAKLHTNFVFLEEVAEARSYFIGNFENAGKVLNDVY